MQYQVPVVLCCTFWKCQWTELDLPYFERKHCITNLVAFRCKQIRKLLGTIGIWTFSGKFNENCRHKDIGYLKLISKHFVPW